MADNVLNILITAKNNATKELNSVKTNLGALASTAGRYSALIGASLIGISGYLTKMASAAQESENLFTESMGRNAEAARAWSIELSKALGLNQYEIRKTIGIFNVMIESMGFTSQAAFNMSKTLTSIGHDISSFYNISVTSAMEKLQSALVGMPRPLLELGIIVKEETIKSYAYANGIATVGEELTEQQKVLVRVLLILQATGKAQGDLVRTQNSLTNLTRRLTSSFQELSTTLGNSLIPLASFTVFLLLKLVTALKNLAESNPAAVQAILTFTTVLGGLLVILAPILFLLGSIANIANVMGITITAVGMKILIAGSAFVALATAIAAVTFAVQKLGGPLTLLKALWAGILSNIIDVISALYQFLSVFEKIPLVGKYVTDLKTKLFDLAEGLEKRYETATTSFENSFDEAFNEVKAASATLPPEIQAQVEEMKKFYDDMAKSMTESFKAGNATVIDNTKRTTQNLTSIWDGYQNALPEVQRKNLKELKEDFIANGYDKIEVDKWYAAESEKINQDSMKHMEETMSESTQLMKRTFEDVLFDGVRNGFKNMKDIANQVLDDILRMMIKTFSNQLFSGFGGGGGGGGSGIGAGTILGGIGIASSFFGGGGGGSIVNASSSSWGGISGLGAEGGSLFGGFFHKGGIVKAHNGLAPDEIPIIAQTGERVLSRNQNQKYEQMLDGGRGETNVSYTIYAVDPVSFGRLLKQNAAIIHEVTEQGMTKNKSVRKAYKKYG